MEVVLDSAVLASSHHRTGEVAVSHLEQWGIGVEPPEETLGVKVRHLRGKCRLVAAAELFMTVRHGLGPPRTQPTIKVLPGSHRRSFALHHIVLRSVLRIV